MYFPQLHAFIDLFKARLSSDDLTFHFMRFSGALGFPSEFSFFLLLALAIVYLEYFNPTIYTRLRLFLLAGFIIIGIFLSVSRAGLLGVFFIFLIFLFGFIRNLAILKAHRSALVILYSVFLFVLVILFNLKNLMLASGLNLVAYINIADGVDDSILHRLSEISCGFDVLSGSLQAQNTICGLGVIESTFGFFVIRHSFLGLAAFTIWLTFICLLIRNFIGHSASVSRGVGIALVIYVFCFAPFSEVLMRSKGIVLFGTIFGGVLQLNKRYRG